MERNNCVPVYTKSETLVNTLFEWVSICCSIDKISYSSHLCHLSYSNFNYSTISLSFVCILLFLSCVLKENVHVHNLFLILLAFEVYALVCFSLKRRVCQVFFLSYSEYLEGLIIHRS